MFENFLVKIDIVDKGKHFKPKSQAIKLQQFFLLNALFKLG